MECLVLIIPEDRAILIQMDHVVVGQQRDLAAAARRIDHEMGHGHSTRVALERFDDVQTCFDGRPEMICSLGQVGLIQIIGLHPRKEQLMDEAFHDFRIVIHAFEENRLGAQGNAGICEPSASSFHFRCQFVRMIEMQVHVNGMVLFHHVTEFGRDALRQRPGDPRADPYELQVGIVRSAFKTRSRRWSGSSSGSPPERMTSRTSLWSRRY